MKARRKLSSCPNCGQMLDRNYNFCPVCGQENDDKNVSFKIIVNEFLSTFFALDNSFFRTIKPFLIKPGYLTLEFVGGKRRSYANPIRLYLIVSLFYFFVIGLTANSIYSTKSKGDVTIMANDSVANYVSQVLQLPDDSLSWKEKGKILDDTFEDMDFAEQQKLMDMVDTVYHGKIYDLDLIEYNYSYDEFGNFQLNAHNYEENRAKYEEKAKDTTEFILGRMNEPLIRELDYVGPYTDQEILDSMHLGQLKWWEKYMAIQRIRIERQGGEALSNYIVKNLSLMMLLVIPIFALILKGVYFRRGILYIQHLIHALHLHSFAYLFYGLTLLLTIYLVKDDDWSTIVNFAAFILVSTYAYISFLRVYRQGWLKTVVIFNLVGWVYVFVIITFFLLEAGVSLLLF